MPLTVALQQQIIHSTQAKQITHVHVIQSLWSGYGQLLRVELAGAPYPSVIVKHIQLPSSPQQAAPHPKGWNSVLSHQRKLQSYLVEMHWYQHISAQCPVECYVPKTYFAQQQGQHIVLIMEDLTQAGFNQVHGHPYSNALSQSSNNAHNNIHNNTAEQIIHTCLQWLGQFHGTFMQTQVKGLWPQGSYWHLATRPDEWAALTDLPLKHAAQQLDQQLQQCRYQTLIHGDAKLANFCFNDNNSKAAAVDFQYVGGGCGMQDVILCLSSCIRFDESEQQLDAYLQVYFSALSQAIARHHPQLSTDEVIDSWQPLFVTAWADFQRFIKGWSPSHVKINPLTERLTAKALQQLAD
ncbi:phosphotransferase [Shewanella intestini]|uniref:Phosphotransferase n=1 Tax=Shewanella intestini TaxID=2017544 RepID=A0ABS5I3Z2_9GAMM|nr:MULTISPECIES: phosphotransferase [Shewanella]MBR9728414.1 phosphotransferase [Shewanella intestini]MRG36756.1 phosphotransferase [Shewanella sp. XMDDZSB0408]